MRGTFGERTRELATKVGHGVLSGQVVFPGPYAAVQHEGYWITGPLAGVYIQHYTTPGTGPKYLEGPLMERYQPDLQQLADNVLDGRLEQTMIAAIERLASLAEHRAPKLTGDLGASHTTIVESDGHAVYERRGPESIAQHAPLR